MQIKYFIRTTGERVLDESIHRELGDDYTLLVDYEHNSGKAFINQLLEINNYNSILLEDDIILCKDFKNYIEKIIAIYPNIIINFFTFPMKWFKSEIQYFNCYNQCIYFPKGFGQQIYNNIIKYKFIYSRQESILKEVLYKMNIKVLNYRPCLVQHIDNGSLMNHNFNFYRRSPYFIDYLKELNISYEEAYKIKNKQKLIQLMKSKFK